MQAASTAIGARPIATLHQPAPTRPAGEVVRPGGLPAQPTPGLHARETPAARRRMPKVLRMEWLSKNRACRRFPVFGCRIKPIRLRSLRESSRPKRRSGCFENRCRLRQSVCSAFSRYCGANGGRDALTMIRRPGNPKLFCGKPLPPFQQILCRGCFGASVPRKGDDAGRVPHPFYNRPLGLGLIRRLVEAASSDNTGRMASATRHDNPASQEPGTVLRKTVSTSGADDSRWMFRAFIPRIGDSGRPLQTFHSRPLGLGLVHRLAESTLSDNTGRVNSATGRDNPVSLDSDIALQKTAVTIRTAPWPDLFRAPVHRKENAESGRSRHPFPGVPLSLESVRKVADPVAVMRNLFRETNFGKPSPNRLPVVAADITSESPAQEAYSTSARSRTDAPAGVLHRHRPGIGLPVFQPAVTLMERTISRSSTGQPVEAVSARHRRPTANLPATGLPWISPAAFGAGADQFSNRDSSDNAVNRLPSHGPRTSKNRITGTSPRGAGRKRGRSVASGSRARHLAVPDRHRCGGRKNLGENHAQAGN